LCRDLIDEINAGVQPRYNVALTQRMPVVRPGRPKAILTEMVFGLMSTGPAGAKPMLLANARAETLTAKPAFADALRTRRCLIPADGFFEWEKAGSARLPHYFALRDRRAFFFAGLWQPETELTPPAFAIVTTTPNELIGRIHDRMPVILGPNSGPAWLGDEPLAPARIAQLCRPLSADLMAAHRVHPRMNRATHEGPDCIEPVKADPAEPELDIPG